MESESTAPTAGFLEEEFYDLKQIELKSNLNNIYLISFRTNKEFNTLYIQANIKNFILKTYSKNFFINDIKKNGYFLQFDNVEEIWNEILQRLTDSKISLKEEEEKKSIILVIPLPSTKIKEITFELFPFEKNNNEIIKECNKIIYEQSKEIKKLKNDLESFKDNFLNQVYPKGSVYLSVVNQSPEILFGGKWEIISEGRFLQGVKIEEEAGRLIEPGLPNIVGGGLPSRVRSDYSEGRHFFGALVLDSTLETNLDGEKGPRRDKDSTIYFDASKSNQIYGKSSTVQPPAFTVYIWKRIS